MHHVGARRRCRRSHGARAGAVDARGLLLGVLGAVDVGPARAVDHGVGARGLHGGADQGGMGEVEVAAGEGDHVVPGRLGGGHDVTSQHARGARDEKAHRRR